MQSLSLVNTNKSCKKDRNQSIELLRILLMTLILFGHIIGFGIGKKENPDGTPSLYALIQPLYLFHVDAFIFISGYYGMNLKWNKFFMLIAKMIIYSIFAYLCYSLITSRFSLSILLHNLYPISACDWWFMAQYLFLMLMVPFLNAGMEQFNKKQTSILIIVFYLASFRIFSCLLVFIYLLARYMRRYPIKNFENHAGIIFVLTLSLFYLFNIVCLHFNVYPKKMYEYMSPFNICAAAAIFYMFKKITITWKGVGFISSGVLAAYLITTHELLQVPFNHLVVSIIGNNIIFCILAALAIVLFCSLIDKIISQLLSAFIRNIGIYDTGKSSCSMPSSKISKLQNGDI